MSYLVLARKWRPTGFEDLVGQEPITRILGNAITQGRIAHAYLFSGPRGVGKTSSARILAKALNCEKGPTAVPCGSCPSCAGITDGSSVDVMEIDGASNNSVNDIRDLRERVKYAPAGGRYKVYIIDEVHMLSDSAFNALLKTLEEPPAHVIFVLATTAPRKIPATVLSRCQHLPFRRVPVHKIRERLRLISDSEGIRISEDGLDLVARAADGSMRDSLTILDQVSAFSADIQEPEIKSLLGIADFGALSGLAGAVIGGNRELILEIIAELADRGADFKSFAKDLMTFFRDLVVAKAVKQPEKVIDASEGELKVMREIIETAPEEILTLLLGEMIRMESDVRTAFSARVSLEMSLLKASFLSHLRHVKEAIANLDRIVGGPIESSGGERAQGKTGETTGLSLPVSDRKSDAPVSQFSSAKALKEAAERGGSLDRENADQPKAETTGSDNVGFWGSFVRRVEEVNHPLASKLAGVVSSLEGGRLTIILNGGSAIHADSIKKNQETLEEIASVTAGRKVSISIETVKKKAQRKSELKEKALSEPFVQEAIELFDGRIVSIKPIENRGKGGPDV